MKSHFKNKLFVVFFIILQSCNSFPKTNINCRNINKAVSERYSLFKNLDRKEINRRKNIKVPTYSKLEELSVFTKIVESVKNAKKNTKLITIDLRNYKSVNLGNIVISNIESDLSLNLFLRTSKYSQGFFALINFGKDKITLLSPTLTPNNGGKYFERQIIDRSDLQNVELVFNVKDSKEIFANMKFNEKQKISLLARNIKKPFRLDLREASNNQYNLGKKWTMSVYDISNSAIEGGKKTSGHYLYVNNNNVKNIKLHKFNKSKVMCYSNPTGLKLEESIDSSLK